MVVERIAGGGFLDENGRSGIEAHRKRPGVLRRHMLHDDVGASDYLLKPIDHKEFTELLSQTIRRQQRWRTSLLATWKAHRQLQESLSD